MSPLKTGKEKGKKKVLEANTLELKKSDLLNYLKFSCKLRKRV